MLYQMSSASLTPFVFDAAHLTALARAHRDRYASAAPFPHVVFDDFLPLDHAAVQDRQEALHAGAHVAWRASRGSAEVMARWNTTLFRRRPGSEDADNLFILRVTHYLRQCVPPIVIDLKRHLLGRRWAGRRSNGSRTKQR
jgi:hypothetical protein